MDDEHGARLDGLRRTSPEIAKSYRRSEVRPGDLVVSIGPSFGKVMVVPADLDGANLTQGTARIALTSATDTRFAFWVLRARTTWEFWDAGCEGATFSALTLERLSETPFPNLDLDAQHRIANFLDRKTSVLDDLIEKKNRLIEALHEKRQAVLESALSAATGLKAKLSYYVDLLPGLAFSGDGFRADGIRLLRGVNVGVGCIRWSDVVYWDPALVSEVRRFILRDGDLVFGMDRPWIGAGLRVARVGVGDLPSLLVQRVARLRAKNGLTQDYLLLLLNSADFRSYFEPIMTGVSVPHISGDQILGFRFALPSREGQRHAVEEVERFDRVARSLERAMLGQIERLYEYRLALISAAVTGRLDLSKEAF